MKLYHNPKSRSTRPNWLLEELGLDAERIAIEFSTGQHKSPEYLAVNPLGQLPAFVDGDAVITESLAICLYLTDAYGTRLKPEGGPALATYYRWVAYVSGTIEPRAMAIYGAKGDEAREAAARKGLADAVQVVADAFGDGPWLVGDQFTTADVMLGSTLMWVSMMGLVELPPALGAWIGRITARPAWKRAFGQA